MRLTAFFRLYKMCTLLHRCDLEIFSKKSVWKISNFRENSATFHKNLMLQNLQNFANSQKIQLDNLVDSEKSCRTRSCLQRSVPIQPKTSNILQKFCRSAVVSPTVTGTKPIRDGHQPDRAAGPLLDHGPTARLRRSSCYPFDVSALHASGGSKAQQAELASNWKQ